MTAAVILYSVAAMCELAGISITGFELRAALRDGRGIINASLAVDGDGFHLPDNPPPPGGRFVHSREAQPAMYQALMGLLMGSRRRRVGVWLLAAGVLIGTAGNLASLSGGQ